VDLASGVIDGAVYVLTSPLALCALLATCLLLGSRGRAPAPAPLTVFVAGATVTRWLPVVEQPLVVPGILLVLGVLIAANVAVRGPAGFAIGAAGGAAAGLGGGMQMASVQEVAGGDAALVGLLALVCMAMALVPAREWLSRPVAVGRRMAGAWIAAIGALMLALSWRGV
jgi:hypothetical protein